MKKTLLVLLLAVALVVPAFAAKTVSKSKKQQTKQSNVFIGGQIYYENDDYDGVKRTEFDFAPYIGFSINEKWDIGGSLVFINRKDETTNPTRKVSGWDICPFARYNVIEYGKFTFYIKGELMIGKYDLTEGNADSVSITEFGLYAAPQIQFNFTDNLSLIGTLNFARIGYEKEDGDNYKHSDFYFGEGNGSLYTVGIEYKF